MKDTAAGGIRATQGTFSSMMCIGEICLKTNDDMYLKKSKLMFKFVLRPILITLDMSKLAKK